MYIRIIYIVQFEQSYAVSSVVMTKHWLFGLILWISLMLDFTESWVIESKLCLFVWLTIVLGVEVPPDWSVRNLGSVVLILLQNKKSTVLLL